MKYWGISWVAMSAVVLSGCDYFDNNMKLARAEPLFGESYDHCFDDPAFLLTVMAPSATSQTANNQSTARSHASRGDCVDLKNTLRPYFANDTSRTDSNSADVAPYASVRKSALSNLALQRNEVTHALVTISNRKCGVYSAHLKTFDGQTNSLLSVLAIATGGIGGVVQAAGAARALSSAAAISSGTRVALNDAWFSNQTIQVLVAGYEKERSTFLRTMNQRQVCPITHYPVMAGIADAMQYHSQCSLISGLSAAAQAIERSDEPGLDVMRRQLVAMAAVTGQAESLMSGLPSDASGQTKQLAAQFASAERAVEEAIALRTQNQVASTPANAGGDAGESAPNIVVPPAELEFLRNEKTRLGNLYIQSIAEDDRTRVLMAGQRFSLNSSQAEKLVCPFDGGSFGEFTAPPPETARK